MPGGGPAGATFGILEDLSQTNNNADFIEPQYRYKFIVDMSVLEIVNLLTVGLTSYNVKYQVPSDISVNNNYIPPESVKSQSYLDKINQWTEENLMMINNKKTKNMIFNFSRKYQYYTR